MGLFLTYVPPPEIVIINHDAGGVVRQYEDLVARYASEGRRIEIKGMCSSACTLALGVPGACVTKTGQAAWHHAYDPDTHEMLPQITKRMIQNLPTKLRAYLDGKIQRDYTPETILGYEQLVALGVKSCDVPAEQIPAIMTNAFYSTVTKKVNIKTDEEFPVSRETTKLEEWTTYWAWAERRSNAQFGNAFKSSNCFSSGLCTKIVYYYDKKGQYAEAVEHIRGSKVVDRLVCRSASAASPDMTCTDWSDGFTIKYLRHRDGKSFTAEPAYGRQTLR